MPTFSTRGAVLAGDRQVGHQQADCGRARPEPALELEPAAQDRAGRGLERVVRVVADVGECALGGGEPLEEASGRPRAGSETTGRVAVRTRSRTADGTCGRSAARSRPSSRRRRSRSAGAVGCRQDGRPGRSRPAHRGRRRRGGRGPPRGSTPPRAPGRPRPGAGRRRQHRAASPSRPADCSAPQQPGDARAGQPGERRRRSYRRSASRRRRRAMPPSASSPYGHGLRGEAPVDDAVAVGVADGLGDLAKHGQLVGQRDAAGLVGQPEVEPLAAAGRRGRRGRCRVRRRRGRAGRRSPSWASRDMTRNSWSATGVRGRAPRSSAPGAVTKKRMRCRSVVATRWKAGQSCQPSPSPSGSSSMTQEPTSRWRRWTTPIFASSAAMISSRFGPTTCCGVGRLEQPLGDARQAGARLVAVDAEQVDLGARRQRAAHARVVEEDGLLDEGHDLARVGHLLVVLA